MANKAMSNIPMTAMQSNHTGAPTLAFNRESSDIEAPAVIPVKTPPADSPRPVHGWRWGLAGKQYMSHRDISSMNTTKVSSVSAILSSVFFFSLDQTIVADIIPDIVDHFGEIQKLPWISVTLLLAAAGTINFWYCSPQVHSRTSSLQF